MRHPVAGLVGNSLLLAHSLVVPPVNPLHRVMQQKLVNEMPAPLAEFLDENFPRFRQHHRFRVMVSETAGLEVGIFLPCLVSLLLSLRRWRGSLTYFSPHAKMVILGGVLAALIYMAVVGTEAAARVMAVFYPIPLIAVVGLRVNSRLARRWPWVVFAALCMAVSLPTAIVDPTRRLVPEPVLATLLQPVPPIKQRLLHTNQVYSTRVETMRPLAKYQRPGHETVYLVSAGRISTLSISRPFGERRLRFIEPERVREVPAGDRAIFFIKLPQTRQLSNRQLEQLFDGQILGRETLYNLASGPPETWIALTREGRGG